MSNLMSYDASYYSRIYRKKNVKIGRIINKIVFASFWTEVFVEECI